MRVPQSIFFMLLLGTIICSDTCVSAFVPTGSGKVKTQTDIPALLRSSSSRCQSAYENHFDVTAEKGNALRERGCALWKRLDTLEAAGLAQPVGLKHSDGAKTSDEPRSLLSSATSLGFVGHSVLVLLSTLIANIIKAAFFTKPPTEEEELLASTGDTPPKQSGMMDRCPWPFIFFHDPKTGLKDSPTWVLFFWAVLYRIWKNRYAAAVV